MSTFTWFRILVGAACYSAVLSHGVAMSKPPFEHEIAAIAERVSLAPRASLIELDRLQKEYAPLPIERKARVYEQMSRAKFYSADFESVLEYGKLLETLGKQNNDKSIECLGILQQVYGNWKLGRITLAYALTHDAERFLQDTLSDYARINSQLTTAQMAAEEHADQDALRSAANAVQIARASKDSAMLFMATSNQAMVALSIGNLAVATKAMNELLSQSTQSPYVERRIRAKGVEFAIASYAGMTARANQALAERLRLVRELKLNEALASTLVDYADLKLKSQRYAEAEALSAEALQQGVILFDRRLVNLAHFKHAISGIHLGKIKEGKAEVEPLFASNHERAQLLSFLPEYEAVLTQAGDANASVQATAIRKRLEFEDTLHRAKESEKTSSQIDLLDRERQLKALEEQAAPGTSKAWLMIPIGAGSIALLFIVVRLRARRRTASSTSQAHKKS